MTKTSQTEIAPPACDILIAGGGTSAGIAAIALAQAGYNVACYVPPYQEGVDQDDWASVVALSNAAMNMLKRLGIVNSRLPSQRLEHMKLDQRYAQRVSGRLEFADSDGLAQVVSNSQLFKAVRDQLAKTKLTLLPAPIQSFNAGDATLTDGSQCSARLCVDASGRHSNIRSAADIDCKTDDYHQDAIVTWVEHSKSHDNQALQFFTATGPLALLPIPDVETSTRSGKRALTRSALVWSQDRARAQALLSVPETMFLELLNEEVGDHRGQIDKLGPRLGQPLEYLLADNFTALNIVLIGEAAHVVHPLAGQGLNLTLRDIAQLVDCLSEAKQLGLDWASETILQPYSSERRADASLTLALTHQLQSLFKSKNRLSQILRSGAMHAANTALRSNTRLARSVLGQADQGLASTPKLMREFID
jgi:2-octaprenyl-6-methoxyphenol hydroxylase